MYFYYLIDFDQNSNRILTGTETLNLASSIPQFAFFFFPMFQPSDLGT